MAYHFHWSREEIVGLPHKERHRWIEEISKINRRINETAGGSRAAATPSYARSTKDGGIEVDGTAQFLESLREQGIDWE